jgi:hypothetical protein
MIKFQSCGDFIAEVERAQAEIAAEVVATRRGVSFPLAGRGYLIEWDQIANERHLLGWVDHLCAKSWITRKIIQRFVQVCVNRLGIKIHPLP